MFDEKKTLGCFLCTCSALIVFTVIFLFCSCGTALTPIARNLRVQCPDSLEIRVDGITQGYGPEADVLIIENFPNVLEIGDWTLVLCPGFTVDTLLVE